jgi:hypothetical protein
MKKIIIMLMAIVMCFSLCACDLSDLFGGKGFSESHFEGDGIYQEYDDLTEEEREQYLSEAVEQGYSVGFDAEGRITLTKDGKTLVLGRSRLAGR